MYRIFLPHLKALIIALLTFKKGCEIRLKFVLSYFIKTLIMNNLTNYVIIFVIFQG